MAYIGNTQQNQSYSPAVDYFSGTGSTTSFTLSRPVASVAQIEAVIENVVQNPSSAYTVSGNTITFTSAPPSGTNNIYIKYTSPNTQVVQPGQSTVYPSSLSTGGMYWDTSGNVGIGTTSPGYPLDVQSESSNGRGIRVRGRSSDGIGTIQFTDSAVASEYAKINTPAANTLAFGTAGTERMRIDSSGNVGIGTSSPSAKLHVAGSILMGTGANEFLSVFANQNATVPSSQFQASIGYNMSAGAAEVNFWNRYEGASKSFNFLQKRGHQLIAT